LTERLVALGAKTRAFVHYNSAGRSGWLDRSPVREDVEVVLGDVCDPGTLRAAVAGVDVVFHLAALIAIPYSYRAPLSYIRTNVEGTANVLQAALDAGVSRVVHTSTSEVYGTPLSIPIAENHPLQGQSPYAASKIGADKIAEAFHRSFAVPVATLRPFNTYGPRQSARAVIPTIIVQALHRPEVRLGNLAPTRDLNFVADTVDGFLRVAEHPDAVGQVFNLGSGDEIAVGELATTILRLLGEDKPIVGAEPDRTRPAASEVDRLCADSRKAREVLGWRPHTSLVDGIRATAEWIRQNPDDYRPGDYAI
jgi:NAD dependent epimerase/dehydratase